MRPMLRMIKAKNKKQKQHISKKKQIAMQAIIIMAVLSPHTLWAKGEITQINTHRETVNSLTYSANGQSYTWQGDNLIFDSFVYNGTTYDYTVKADNVKIRRVDNSVATDERCALFAEADSSGSSNLKPSYPRLNATNNCDMAAVMGGNVINRGVLDLFNNIQQDNDSAKNIERVDFIFSGGVTTPIDPAELTQTGVVVTEKSGNNDVLIAAILSLDSNGDPASYGPAVRVYHNGAGSSTKYAYGITNISYPITFLANEKQAPQGYVYKVGSSSEALGMVFIDMEALELSAGQTWYGFSYFSPDIGDNSPNAKGQITLNKDPVDFASFPTNTDRSVKYGDADVYGGVGGYFVKSSLNNISGTAYKDDNANGSLDVSETGISNIKVTLYKDNNSNGTVQLSDTEYPSINTDSQGSYSFVGVPSGNYLVVIDKNDTDTPSSYQLSSNEILAVTINNASSQDNDFSYIKNGLSITKTMTPASAIIGENVTFTITVSNDSSIDATGVSIVDKLSDAVSYVSDDSSGSYSSASGIWSVGNINKNTSKTLTITATVN